MRVFNDVKRISAIAILSIIVLPVTKSIASDLEQTTPEMQEGIIAELKWHIDEEPGVGWEGSPATCDLYQDGTPELIVPVNSTSRFDDSYIAIINPKTGERVFRTELGETGFSYPLCVDVNDDGVLDIITGGQIQDVHALSGIDGQILWRFSDKHPEALSGHTFTPVSTSKNPNYFFITTGGGSDSNPNGERNPGSILVISRYGDLLAKWDEPDKSEIYSTPALKRFGSLVFLAVGSGGETLPGKLHFLVYSSKYKKFISLSSVDSACDTGGFIASPTMGDVTGDRFPEVIANDMCGRVYAFSLLGRKKWHHDLTLEFPLANPLLSDVNGDGIFDVIIGGNGPNFGYIESFFLQESSVSALNGKDGTEIWSNHIDDLMLVGAPGAADLDQDGIEDIWVVTGRASFPFAIPLAPSYLLVYSGKNGEEIFRHENVNWLGTPLVGDANKNGLLDVFVIDAPTAFVPVDMTPGSPITTMPIPAQSKLLEFPEVQIKKLSRDTYSGFRGPRHDGYRKSPRKRWFHW